jgi:hypothetical protein
MWRERSARFCPAPGSKKDISRNAPGRNGLRQLADVQQTNCKQFINK